MKIIPSTININRVADWVNSYFDWFMFNTKTIDPLMMNRNKYLIRASYHKEEGRNGYVPPESGSSESQFLTLLGFLYMFKATRDLKWLDVSKKIADACLKIMYNNKSIPTTDFDEDYLFIPNWLFNADVVSFTGEKYYVDKKVTFANGVGTFTSAYTARKIFSARTLESTLLWDSPYSTIIGKDYLVASYTANDKNFTVTLEDTTFNGDLLVVYSDMGGDTIVPGECFEAYPMWRKLQDEEVACAIDSLWWSYECWKLLYEFTGETKYYNLYQNELKVIEYVCSIPNANDYLGVAFDTTNPFSISGSFQYNERTVAPTFSRDSNSGCIVIDVPQGTGKIDIGKGGINEVISKDRYYKLKISTGVATKMKIIMTDSIEYNDDRRWYHQVKTSGNNTLDEFTMKQSDFIQDKYIFFDLEIKTIEEDTFHGDSSTVTLTKVFDDNNEAVRRVDFDKVVEGGWCQYLPNVSATYDSLPLMIYRGGKGISIRIKDANGWLWYRLLNEHTSFTSEIYDFTGFILSNYQTNTGTPPASLTAPVSQILFESVDSASWIELKRIGDITKCQMPQGITLQSMIIEFDEPSAQKVKIRYLRPVPVEGYSYVPWVAPFSLNTINNSISDWRGTPYVGYQCPWIWQEYNKPEGAAQVLDFIQKSQDAYEKITNTSLRFFTQVFVWDRWDCRNYGSINEFTWDGPDPNTFWGGYQYRALETVAKTLYNDSTLTVAKTIIEDFLNSLLTVWTNTSQQIPTGFNKDGSITQGQEPHDVALLLRAAIYAYESGVCNEALCLNVIDKCMNNLNYCYAKTSKLTDFNSLSTKGTWFAWNMWYGYWGGEIMRTLAVLMKFSKNELFVKTDSGIKLINTYPLWYDLENYISIKTPIGCQKMELVDVTDSLSTPLRIKTSDSVKCLKGSNYALPTDFNNRAVFTFVDDDGSAAFLNNIKPEFDKRGLKCNLAIISGVVGSDTYLNLNQIKELENEGYEMLCHSDNLDSLVVDTADTHLSNATNWFKANGIDYSDCLVYPNGNTGDTKSQIQTIAGNHFKYALNVTGGNMVKPYVYLDLSRIYISKTTGLNSWVKSVIDECLSTNGWIVFYTHSWMCDGSDGEFSKKSLQDILDYILDNSGKILTFKQALQGKV